MEYAPCQNQLHGPDHDGCPECGGECEVPEAQAVARVTVHVFAIMRNADPDAIRLHRMDETGGQYRCPVGERTAVCGFSL